MSILIKISKFVSNESSAMIITDAEFEEIKSHINTNSSPLPKYDLPSLVYGGSRIYFVIAKKV